MLTANILKTRTRTSPATSIGGCRSLRELVLTGCQGLTGTLPSSLGKCSALRVLNVKVRQQTTDPFCILCVRVAFVYSCSRTPTDSNTNRTRWTTTNPSVQFPLYTYTLTHYWRVRCPSVHVLTPCTVLTHCASLLLCVVSSGAGG